MLDIQKTIGSPKIIVSDISDDTQLFTVENLPRGF
jgi:hypothetical protein